jgi:hypothetical protein
MLKIEDYNKKNLEECISFLKKEIDRVKVELITSGFIKYSPMGMVMLNYRKELKRLCYNMMDDLNDINSEKEI